MHRQSFSLTSLTDRQEHMKQELANLLQTAPPQKAAETEAELNGFQQLFNRFLQETGKEIEWDQIQRLPEGAIRAYDSLPKPANETEIRNYLNKLVVVKLNGGLGTSMGCTGPKSVISVRENQTFLDLTVRQIEHLNEKYNSNVPLVLMNSFNTEEDTSKVLRKYRGRNIEIKSFMQSRYPRIDKESLSPIAKSLSGTQQEAWYPPGHGNFYEAIYNAGLVDEFLKDGRKYLFLSNIDNLGAIVDLNILTMLLQSENAPEFLMEVTDKTRADVKGGTLVKYGETMRLLEIAQVPKNHVDEFKSVTKFKIFNTNNIWVNIGAIKRQLSNNDMKMEVIINHKTLANGQNVIQLETACGDAIRNFKNALGVNVPRRRFLPVKKTSDLLLVMSNLYAIDEGGLLIMNPQRSFPSTPLVKLGSSFDQVRELLNRFASIPDMLELDHLTVSGDVTFGKNVSLKGTVIIMAHHGARIDIPSGSQLENKIVQGNLRILDH